MSDDIHALVGAYALDAVDDLERAAFDRHLRGCGACQAEVTELQETAARLADGTWSVPPPALRDFA
jgi:anti-sigma factor RsiW